MPPLLPFPGIRLPTTCHNFASVELVLAGFCRACGERVHTPPARVQAASGEVVRVEIYNGQGKLDDPNLLDEVRAVPPQGRFRSVGFAGGVAVFVRGLSTARVVLFRLDPSFCETRTETPPPDPHDPVVPTVPCGVISIDLDAFLPEPESIGSGHEASSVDPTGAHVPPTPTEPLVRDGLLLVTLGRHLLAIDLFEAAPLPRVAAVLDDDSQFVSGPKSVGDALYAAVADPAGRARVARIHPQAHEGRLAVHDDAPWPHDLLGGATEPGVAGVAGRPTALCLDGLCVLRTGDSLWTGAWPAATGGTVKWTRQSTLPPTGLTLSDGQTLRRSSDRNGPHVVALAASASGTTRKAYSVRLSGAAVLVSSVAGPLGASPLLTDNGLYFISPSGHHCRATLAGQGGEAVECDTPAPLTVAPIAGGTLIVDDTQGGLQVTVKTPRGKDRVPLHRELARSGVHVWGDPIVTGRWAAIVWAHDDKLRCTWVRSVEQLRR